MTTIRERWRLPKNPYMPSPRRLIDGLVYCLNAAMCFLTVSVDFIIAI